MSKKASVEGYEIIISKEIKEFISPLSEEEYHFLEQNILAYGCKDPLTVWNKGNEYILIDGHHRFEICQRHNIDFQIEVLQFDSFENAQIWMLNNQMGRRNLTSDQLSYYRGKKYLVMRKSHGGDRKLEYDQSQNSATTKLLSQEFKVGESTIKRDAKFAEGLDIINNSNPELKSLILMGMTSLKKRDIMMISEIDDKDKSRLKVKNEADLYNKVSNFRKENIASIERKLDEIESTKYADAQAELQSRDSLFLDQDSRLERLKARIISSINDAIRNRNLKAIEELRDLIERLQKELTYGENQ